MKGPRPEFEEFWPPQMHRDGDMAKAPDMAAAYRAWKGHMTSTSLAGCLGKTMAQAGNGNWPFHRIADGMIQRARKAGWISQNGRTWSRNYEI